MKVRSDTFRTPSNEKMEDSVEFISSRDDRSCTLCPNLLLIESSSIELMN